MMSGLRTVVQYSGLLGVSVSILRCQGISGEGVETELSADNLSMH